MPEAALLADERGAILVANRAAGALFGVAPAELEGRALAELAADEPAAIDAFLRLCARSGSLMPGALHLASAQGERTAVRVDGALVERGTGGATARILVRLLPKSAATSQFAALNLRIAELHREVARRREAEAAMREQSELLQVTLASIGDAVITTDPRGQVSFLNPAAEALTGWRNDAARGRPLAEVWRIVDETTREPLQSPLERVLNEQRVVGLARHAILLARDGREVPIDDSAAPIRDAAGRLRGVVLVFHDITERRRYERERAEADRRKDEFLAMLAHELRNPLASIGTGVEVVRHSLKARAHDATLAAVGDAMQRQVRQLARLIDDLLDVSRISTGKVSLQIEPVALDAVVQDALVALRPAIEAREIAVLLEAPPRPPRVRADRQRLAQVVGNLVSNAVKFSPRGARIRLTLAAERGEALIRVTDEGEGIAPALLPSVFELFRQGDTSLARSAGGLGVGLTIAKKITELHGGGIEAASEGPGRGAAFTVRLPLLASEPAEPSGAARPARADGTRRRVLLVDDNVDAASTLASLLEILGHEVRTVHDGPAALALAADYEPEIVLLDLGLPGMDGYEVARRLRAAGRAMRIVAVTGYGADTDRQRSAATGFHAHLTKPVDVDTLERLLHGASELAAD